MWPERLPELFPKNLMCYQGSCSIFGQTFFPQPFYPVCVPTYLVHPQRRAHYVGGRASAGFAFQKLCSAHPGTFPSDYPFVVGTQDQGRPLWPPGLTGSITHKGPWAMAVLSQQNHIHGVGVDLEARIKDLGISSKILTQDEQATLGQHPDPLGYVTLTFSAKESLYKCLGRPKGFQDARLTSIHPREGHTPKQGRFWVEILTTPYEVYGGYYVWTPDDAYVLTGLYVGVDAVGA